MRNIKRLFILTILLALATIGHGQDAELCQTGKETAQKLIATGTIYFPRLVVDSTPTFRKLLELNYGIKDAMPDNESCISFESEEKCFYNVMLTEIERKMGSNFLHTQRQISDKLDKEGIGYIRASEFGILDSLRRYVKRNAPKRSPNIGYLIELRISAQKELTDVEVLHGLHNPRPIDRKSNDYLFIQKALNEIELTLEPDKFMGKTVDSVISFYLTF